MKSTTKNMISKEQSYIIKGFAILLMLVHHFYTFPSWIITGGGVRAKFKVCHAI